MDFGVFKDDLRKALLRLPPELVKVLSTDLVAQVKNHRQALEAILPAMKDDLLPHLNAIFMESAMGVLGKEEIERAVIEVLESIGVSTRI